MQLPGAAADGLEFVAGVVVKVLTWLGTGLAGDERPAVRAVDLVGGELAADELGESREEIERAEEVATGAAGGNFAGKAHDAGDADAAFERGELAFAERAGAAGVIAVGEEWAVVGAEDDERFLGEAILFDCGEHFADAAIEFFDYIAIEARTRFSFELVGGKDGHVGHDVWYVEEEGFVF